MLDGMKSGGRAPRSSPTRYRRVDPVEFLGRLAVLVPRPRIYLILTTACWAIVLPITATR
jgi:hypothetical protein